VIPGLELARRVLYEHRLRNRFPRSVIHRGAMADKGSVLGEFSVLFCDVKLQDSWLGAYSYVQSGSVICNAEIGAFCSIAGNVVIGLAAHPTSMVSTSPVFYDNAQPLPRFFMRNQTFTHNLPKTFIGADVWIGQGVMIKAGTRIGVGAVIGAGAIVTKDIPPYVIAAGNPCSPIRPRFSESISLKLLDSRWWDLNETKLEKLVPLFTDPESFLAALESSK
jgi:acetyltransferase-like isoleucine patch superfamily enzyme